MGIETVTVGIETVAVGVETVAVGVDCYSVNTAGRTLPLYLTLPAIALQCSVGATAISAPLKGELSSERMTEGFCALRIANSKKG